MQPSRATIQESVSLNATEQPAVVVREFRPVMQSMQSRVACFTKHMYRRLYRELHGPECLNGPGLASRGLAMAGIAYKLRYQATRTTKLSNALDNTVPLIRVVLTM